MNLQQLIALQKASGGQNVITPDNAGRIMGLAAQQEANRQLSLAAGRTAVQEALDRQVASGERQPQRYGEVDEYGRVLSPLQQQGRVVTAPSGAKFVTDAQGNVVGTNAPLTGGTMLQNDKGVAAGRGETPSSSLGERIRSAFQTEMQKRAPVAPSPPTQQEQNQKFIEKTAPFNTPPIPDSQTPAAIPNQQEMNAILERDYGYDVNAPTAKAGVPALRQAFEQQALKSEKESVGTRLSDAERKAKEAMTRFESGKGSASKEELQALAEEYAAAQAEAELLNTPPQEQEAKLAELIKQIRQGKAEKMEPKGIFPRIGFGYESGKSYVSDAFQNAIMNPLREAFTGETAKPSNELYRYLLQQQLMRQAGF